MYIFKENSNQMLLKSDFLQEKKTDIKSILVLFIVKKNDFIETTFF